MNGVEVGLLVLMPAVAAVALSALREVRDRGVWICYAGLAAVALGVGAWFQRGDALVNGPLMLALLFVVVPWAGAVAVCRVEAVRRSAVATFLVAPVAMLAGVFMGVVIGVNGGLLEP
jgi:hypothetical protein